jgi:hypothetical protein
MATLTLTGQAISALISERDRQKADAIAINLREQLTNAQIQLMGTLQAVIAAEAAMHALRKQNRELLAADLQKQRYRLVGVGPGLFAYALRPQSELVEGVDEPAHMVCQPCLDSGHRAVLRREVSAYTGTSLVCPRAPGHEITGVTPISD